MPTAPRHTIGVLAGWQHYWTPTPLSYLSPIFRGIRRAAEEAGCNLLLACGMGSSATAADPLRPAWFVPSPDSDFVPVGPWNTDGLIVVNPLHTAQRSRDIQSLADSGHPVVFIGAGEPGPTVAADNRAGIRAAVDHLVAHGHTVIAFIAGSPEDLAGDTGARLDAYRAALRERGLPADERLWAYGRHTYDGGYAAARALLEGGAHFTAVVASNDESALGAMQALSEAGRRVPGDVAVVGFDDRLESALQRPSLSSIAVSLPELGVRAVDLLLRRLRGESLPAEPVLVPTHLVARESCGCGEREPTREAAPGAPATGRTEVIAAFERSLQCRAAEPFDSTFSGWLRERAAADDDATWRAALDLLVVELPARVERGEAGARSFGRDLLLAAQTTLSRHIQRSRARLAREQRWTFDRLGLLTARLLDAREESQVYDALAGHLPSMGIDFAAVATFQPAGGDPLAVSQVRVLAPAVQPPLVCPTRAFPPPGLLPPGLNTSLALLPLVNPGGQLGFVAFGASRLELYGSIVQELAAALHAARLNAEATEGRRLAEEANRMKSRFLSTVSHELRTPLNLILGLSEILLRQGDAANQADLERLHANARHLGRLIGDVLDLAGSDSGRLRLASAPVDLAAVLAEVSETGRRLAADKGLGWRAEAPSGGLWVWGDGTRLSQVTLNLISNAIKFTQRGEVSVELVASEDTATVRVRDTGIGVPPAEQAAIFEEFGRSARSIEAGYGGLGLGLSISKRLVELHGGAMGVESSGEQGAGSVFYFTLPLMAPPAAPVFVLATSSRELAYFTEPVEAAPAGDGLAPLPARTILVVDDDPDTLALHARLARQRAPSGRVRVARNGLDALRILADEPVDLVLLDLTMPDMDGFAVLEAMRAQPATRSIPVIVVTGQNLSESDMARLNLRVTRVLNKGVFSVDETLSHLDAALARRRDVSGEAQRLVRQAVAFMHAHYAEPLTREQIAARVGLNPDYLTSSFRKELGLAPVAYLNRYRVEQARRLLRESDQSITEIALAVGFSGSSYFSRIFHRETGMSPAEYRRAG